MSQSPRTYLGFDYGSKRIGVAVGQDLTGSASALATLKSHNQTPPWQAIEALVQQWQPQAFVVGLPYNKDGTEHTVTQAARRFGRQLQGRFQRPVYWVDERLTSSEAESILAQRGRKAKKDEIDKLAAQLILQSWLVQHRGEHDLKS
ncbi:Holliday junction resolvase RuvX [Kaarinaea lacus]